MDDIWCTLRGSLAFQVESFRLRYRALPFTSTQQGPGKDSHPTGNLGFLFTKQPLSKTEENAEAHCAGGFDLNSHRFKRWRSNCAVQFAV